MELRSSRSVPSVASTPPHREAESSAPVGPASPLPPILSPQVTASEAIEMLDAPDIAYSELLEIADTLVSLRAPPNQLPPPLPSQPPPNSASYPRPDHNFPILSLETINFFFCRNLPNVESLRVRICIHFRNVLWRELVPPVLLINNMLAVTVLPPLS